MDKKKALTLLLKISRNYDLAMRATDRATARGLQGHTSKALEERDKAMGYVEKAVDAECDLRDIILQG